MKKRIFSAFMAVVMVLALVPMLASSNSIGKFTDDDYIKALWMTTRFYGAQRMGEGPNWLLMDHVQTGTRAPYTNGKSYLKDADGSHNLVGGWFDCGDHIMFGQTFYYAAYVLALAYKTFPEGFHDLYHGTDYSDYAASRDWSIRGGKPSGIPDILEELKYATDFIIKATPNATTFYSQKGDGTAHQQWVTAPFMSGNANGQGGEASGTRPITKNPADGVMASYAAATLAVMSQIYRPFDAAYANTCLAHARNAYAYARANRTRSTGAGQYYQAHKDPEVPFIVAASEMFMATNESTFSSDINVSQLRDHWHVFDYSNSHDLAYYAAAMALPAQRSTILGQMNTNFVSKYTSSSRINSEGATTLGGDWGELRYNGNVAFITALYSKAMNITTHDQFIYNQIDYILGANNARQSFITGFDERPIGVTTPTRVVRLPHHRNVFLDDRNANDQIKATMPIPERNKYFGYLVGGRRNSTSFSESITGYTVSEGGIDYNAGLLGALGYIVSKRSPATIGPCTCNAADCNRCNPCTCKTCGCTRCFGSSGKCNAPTCLSCNPTCTTCNNRPCTCMPPITITLTANQHCHISNNWNEISGSATFATNGAHSVAITNSASSWFSKLEVSAPNLPSGVTVTLGNIQLNTTNVTHSLSSLNSGTSSRTFWDSWGNGGSLMNNFTGGHTQGGQSNTQFGVGGAAVATIRLNFTVSGIPGGGPVGTTTTVTTPSTPATTTTTGSSPTTPTVTTTTTGSSPTTPTATVTTTGTTTSSPLIRCANCGFWFEPGDSCPNNCAATTTAATTTTTVTTTTSASPTVTTTTQWVQPTTPTATTTTQWVQPTTPTATTTTQWVQPTTPTATTTGVTTTPLQPTQSTTTTSVTTPPTQPTEATGTHPLTRCAGCGLTRPIPVNQTHCANCAATTTTTEATTPRDPSSRRKGDVDGNEIITIVDALEILKFLAGLADNLLDKDMDAKDAARITVEYPEEPKIGCVLEILKYLAGLATLVPEIPEVPIPPEV